MSNTTSMDCLVCRKHRGEVDLPGGAIYENEMIFISHAQLWREEKEHYLGHVFVEAKRHVAEVADLTDEEARCIGLYTIGDQSGVIQASRLWRGCWER